MVLFPLQRIVKGSYFFREIRGSVWNDCWGHIVCKGSVEGYSLRGKGYRPEKRCEAVGNHIFGSSRLAEEHGVKKHLKVRMHSLILTKKRTIRENCQINRPGGR